VNFVEHFIKQHPHKELFFGNETRIFCTDAPDRFLQVARYFTSSPVEHSEKVTLGI
jgi:hypothetical protein